MFEYIAVALGRRADICTCAIKWWVLLSLLVIVNPARGSFHLMQIEQVIGGVEGDTRAQAVQFRMRQNGQNILSEGKLYAWDAQGENPILLIDFQTDLEGASLGDRALAATETFTQKTTPAAEADYILENPIPESYLTAGSITFENDEGELVVCRLSWGGNAYTGSTAGAQTNDDDGEFGPPLDMGLPTTSLQAVLIQINADTLSSSNLSDYALTSEAAVFTNNSGTSFTVTGLECPNDPDDDADGDFICGDVDNCPDLANTDQADRDGDGAGDVCDVCPDDDQTAVDESLCAGDAPNDGDSDETDGDGTGGDGTDGGEPDAGEGDGDSGTDSNQGGTGGSGCGAGTIPLAFSLLAVPIVALRRKRRCVK